MDYCENCDEPEGAIAKRPDGATLCDACNHELPIDSYGLADERDFYDD